MAKAPIHPFAIWAAWGDRAIRSGDRQDCARRARFLDALPSDHPDLKGVTPDERARLFARLKRAAQGA